MPEQILRDKHNVKIGSIMTGGAGDQIIHDAKGIIIGKIHTDPQGVQTAYNNHGQRLGSYEPRLDVTKDAKGSKLGKGCLLLGFFFS